MTHAILGAAKSVLAAATPEAGDRVYARAVLSWAKADGTPCVVVAPTPDRPVEIRHTVSKRVTAYAVTAMLIDGFGGPGGITAANGWRDRWPALATRRLRDGLDLGAVAGDYYVEHDNAALFDTAALDQAGLFRAVAAVTITLREPL